jgi:hypothetical protein
VTDKFVRVKDNQTKHEYTVATERYDSQPEAFTVLKKAATDSTGRPLPMKPHTSVSTEAASKTTNDGPKADSPKEK